MDPINKLFRFIYLGHTDAYYKAKQKPMKKEEVRVSLEFIKTSIDSIPIIDSGNKSGDRNRTLEDPLWPLTSVKKALHSKTIVSKNEAILVLAYCVTIVENDTLRHGIYAAIPEMLSKPEDLFLFIYYSSNFHTGKGFGRGLRTAISKWYSRKTPLEFAEIIGCNRSHYGWSHADVLSLSHTMFTDLDKKAIKGAACKRGYQVIRRQTQLEMRDDLPGLNRLCSISRLKICENEIHAADMIKVHSFKLENIPAHLMKSPVVWQTILSTLTFNQLINYLPFLNDIGLLKPSSTFAKAYCVLIKNATLLDSTIHPIQLLITMKSHQTQKRYSELVHELYREKRIKDKKIEVNPYLVKRLQSTINSSFAVTPRTGLRYFITIDLRKSAFTKSVFGICSTVSNTDVSILMALSIYKREKDVTVMAFSDSVSHLIPIRFTKDMKHEDAVSLCESLAMDKTRHCLSLPLITSQQQKKKCDIFLTFVDSIKRSIHDGQPPLKQFKMYKKHFNLKQLKCIFFNLSQKTNNLNIDSDNMATKGMLEIVGFNAKVPAIIEAFAKNQFY